MKHSFKKLTAWLCCMAMLISFIPATALPVFADEAEAVELTQTTGVLEAGNYALADDLTLETYLEIKSEVTIDLAGHSLIAGEGADGGLLAVTTASGNLTITDSVGGGKLQSGTSAGTPALQIQAGATATLEGGEITGWTRAGGHGGMVFVAAGATFNMEGGKLTDATCAHGAAIRTGGADAVINMSGGEISNCTATSSSPIFLHTDSTFNMTGGTITGNSGVTGGAMCLYSAGAEANIEGGTISNNTASGNGGAICANYGVVTVSGDAAITGNEATGASSYGGAIFLAKNTVANIEGGTISGNKAYRGGAITSAEAASSNVTVNISGGTIENNKATNRGANLYGYDANYNISGGTIGAATVNDAAATGYLNIELRGAETKISGGTIATICTSKGTDYTKLTITGNPVIADLQNSSTNAASTIGALTEGADITYSVIGGLTIADGTVKQVGKNFTYQEPTVPTSGTVAAGEYVLADDLVLTNSLTVAADTEVVIDLAGNTISMPDKDSVYFIVNGKLTIKDSVGGGKVQMKNTAAGHGGIYVYGTGTFVLEGGEITGWTRINDGTYGAGGMFGLWDGATFTMTGGKITGADCGSNTVIRTQSAGAITVTISGGEISGNHAQSGGIIAVNGTADKNATLTINGTAKVDDNTWGANNVDFAATGTGHEIAGLNTHITIGGSAIVGGLYNDAENNTTDNSSYTFTGAPTVASVRWSAGAETPVSITELTEGASITMSSTAGTVDATVARTTTDDNRYLYTYKVPTYAVTVNQTAGGTVEVDVTEGAAGTTVTVTATAAEGYELVDILVNGEAIQGNTFQIVAGDNVVTATFEAVSAALPTSGSVATGEYTLTADHVLTNGLSVAAGAEVTIDLAGHTISLPDKDAMYFTVSGKLTIKDSVGGGKVQFKETTAGNPGIGIYGTFVLESGELNGWTRAGAGGAVYLYANSTFIMTGGLITACDANSDSVIRSAGGGHTITITGGDITGNDTGARIIGVTTPTAAAGSTITIGGDANISGNTKNGEAMTAEEVFGSFTHITVGDEAVIGSLYANASDAVEGVEGYPYGSISITGAPTVGNITLNSSARTPVTINNLTEGANITTGVSANGLDATVVKTAGENGIYTYTWRDPATVYTVTVGEVTNGTVTVDPAEGVYGTTVTVTATAAEGYALETILVDGKDIGGDTFTITGDHEVTATFVEAAAVTYDVVVVNPLGGTVSVDKNTAAEGETITVTATAAEGYELTAILVNGEAIQGNTFTMPAASVQVTATFTEVEVDTGLPTSGVVAAGEYVLEEDLTLTGWLTIRDEVVVDLAGHTITAGEGGNAFLLDKAASKLTIMDSVGGGKVQSGASTGNPAVFLQVAGAQFILEGGEITGWNRASGAGGMVYLLAGTTFTMNGGKLTGASCAGNSIIRTGAGESTITINGGEISGNSVTGNAPIGLASGVTMTVTGGTFTGNTSGGYGLIHVGAGATLNISNGTFTENTAKNGGVIYNEGTVAITGGTFTDNEATTAGGAIQILKGSTTTITGGTFTGNSSARGGAIGTGENVLTESLPVLTIGGTAVIEDNICTEYGANLYAYTPVLTINGGTIGTGFKGEDVVSKSASANVWVRGNAATTVTITGGDINGLTVSNVPTTITGNPVIGEINATINMSALTSGANIRTAATGMVTAGDDTVYTINDRDFYFKGDMGLADAFVPGATVALTEDTSLGGTIVLSEAGNYILDLAGYTLSGTAAPYFTVAAGATLTVIDSSEGKTGKVVGIADATAAMFQVNGAFVLNAGLLTGHGSNVVVLGKNAAMTMNGGEISGNTAARGAVTSGDVTASNVTFTMNGGTIADNICTQRGANLYFYDPAMVTIGGDAVIGTAYVKDAEGNLTETTTNIYQNAEVRGGNLTITGGTIKHISAGKGTIGAAVTISGAPVIEVLNANNASSATISNLTTGARIGTDTNAPLTIAEGDKSVNYTYRLYRFAGDVKTILFVANSFGGDTCKFLTQLGTVYGVELDPAYLYVGSQSIRWHAQSLAESLRNTDLNGDGVIGDSRDRVEDGLYTCAGFEGYVDIPTVMEGKAWDYVVLQPGVQYVGYEGTYNSDINFLMDYIADVQPDAQILWSQTWAVDNRSWSTQVNPDNPEEVVGGEWVANSGYLTHFGGSTEAMYDAILRNTDKFIAGDDARFAFDGWFPIGIAIQTMRNNYSDSYLTRDGFHLSHNAGRLIAGLTVMKTLFPEINLTDLTAEQVAAMFAANTENTSAAAHLQDAFEPTEANVATLLAAVETACGYKNTVPAYGDGTANKQFNPDATIMSSNEYVAVYENVTEVGNVATNETYASAGAGKIVIYKNGTAVSEIDELWLEENAGIALTNRYENLDGTYYIMADAQAPQLAVIGSKLYLTFDVKLYADEQNTIVNGGVYLTTSTDGVTWTEAVKVSDAPMAYGLTALSDGNLIMSVADTATKAVKVSATGTVVSSVELADAGVADVAFVEVGANTFALTSNGALYVSADKGATWTATGVANGATASPDMFFLNDGDYMTVYATWADEAEMKIYNKIWNVDVTNTTNYGWNDTDATVLAEYTVATAYNGKTTGGQPSTVLTSSTAVRGVLKTVYVDGGVLAETDDYTVSVRMGRNLALNSSLAINFLVPQTEIDAMDGSYAKIIRSNAAAGVDPVETIIDIADWDDTVMAGYYAIPFSGLAAKQMGDSVWVAIYNEAGQQVSRLDRYSIKAYAESRFAKNIGAEEKTMLVDMLNYGAAAQNKFSYGTSALVNADLTEEQKALATPVLELDTDLTQNGFVNTVGLRCGKNLTLESVVEMNLNYVAADVPTASYAVATYTDHNGKAVENRIELRDNTLSGLATKLVVVDTMATADVFTQVTVQVYDANDNVIEGTYCVYSIATYAYNTNKTSTTSLDAILSMRLMQFGTSAYNSLH